MALAILGAAGMPDAVVQWREWLAVSEPYLNNGWVRISLIALGILLLWWSVNGQIGRGRFVSLPVAASWINRLTFRRARYVYPLAEAAEQLSGVPRTEFYKRFLVSEGVNGTFTLYQMDETGRHFSAVNRTILQKETIPYRRLAMHKHESWKCVISILSRMIRSWIWTKRR